MPTVRVVNPKRSRVRRANAKRVRRGRDRHGRFLKRKRGRNPAAGGGELLLMNPKRRRVRRNRAHHTRRRNYRRRRKNPVSYAMARPVRRRRRSYANPRGMRVVRRRRHRNPFGISGREIVGMSLWAIAGGVATRAIPQMLMPDQNSGFMGYAANAVTAGVLGYVGDRFIGGSAGKGILIGGLVMLGGRIISDLFGKSLVSFGDVFGTTGTSGLGAHGDPSFDLGLYTPNEFVVPTVSEGDKMATSYSFWPGGPGSTPVVATPAGPVAVPSRAAAAAAAPAAGTSGLGMPSTGRLKSRFAA